VYSTTEKQEGNCKFFEGLDGYSYILKLGPIVSSLLCYRTSPASSMQFNIRLTCLLGVNPGGRETHETVEIGEVNDDVD
jgi:hypothetical protein